MNPNKVIEIHNMVCDISEKHKIINDEKYFCIDKDRSLLFEYSQDLIGVHFKFQDSYDLSFACDINKNFHIINPGYYYENKSTEYQCFFHCEGDSPIETFNYKDYDFSEDSYFQLNTMYSTEEMNTIIMFSTLHNSGITFLNLYSNNNGRHRDGLSVYELYYYLKIVGEYNK